MNNQIAFKIFVLAVFIGLIAPFLIQDGMFMDGQIYAAVSHNLANGLGSFWFPTFTAYVLTDYSEQLPLFFGVQALFFKVFGDSMYTERIFSFVMAILTAFNISLIWKLFYHNDIGKTKMDWLPIFYWVMIPVISWSYTQNVEEVLMSVFATGSVFFILKALLTQKNLFTNLLIGGFLIFLTSFCKGFQGLFPLVTVGFYWLFYRKISFSKAVIYSLVLVAVPLLIYSVLMLIDTSHESIMNYVNNRIVRTFTKSYSATTTNHFSLVIQIFEQLIPVFIIMLLTFITFKIKSKEAISIQWKNFGFFLSLGLSGSLPLMVTLEQRGFYLTTSFPFIAIALAGISATYLAPLLARIDISSKGYRLFKGFAFAALLGAILITGLQFGETRRNKDELHDVYAIGDAIPNHSSISTSKELRSNYAVIAYFARHNYANLDNDTVQLHAYYLAQKGTPILIHEEYEIVELGLKAFDFYKKK